MFYVEKYYSDDHYMNGEMSSCKRFEKYKEALKYFKQKVKEYKKGFLVLSEDDISIGTRIIDEASCYKI